MVDNASDFFMSLKTFHSQRVIVLADISPIEIINIADKILFLSFK